MKYLWKYLAHREIWLLFGTFIFINVVVLRRSLLCVRRKCTIVCAVCSRIVVERS